MYYEPDTDEWFLTRTEAEAAAASFQRLQNVLDYVLRDYLVSTENSHYDPSELHLKEARDGVLTFKRIDSEGYDRGHVTMPVSYLWSADERARMAREYNERMEQQARDRAETHQRRAAVAEQKEREVLAQLKAKYEKE